MCDRPISLFPLNLLAKPGAERTAYFRGLVFFHKAFIEAYDALISGLDHDTSPKLIFVLGCTGVGISCLCQHVIAEARERARNDLNTDPGYIPTHSVEAVANNKDDFDWEDLYRRVLSGLGEPLINFKIDISENFSPKPGKYKSSRDSVETALELALSSCLYHRKLDILLIDQAQHLIDRKCIQNCYLYRNKLRSIATNTNLILSGTPELHHLINKNEGDHIVYLKRYRAEIDDDVHAFRELLYALQLHLPLQEPPNLIDKWEYFYGGSLGCPGILITWLTQALERAIDDQAEALRQDILDRYAISPSRLLQMLQEIQRGEQIIQEITSKNNRKWK